ncbi:hypothetical protein [Hydrotalea sp.]|uniref:hypothetical protein n=1 Tax=Hydrotalea sp. TaxID=2881279 RepID=UPI00260ABE9F|nr:hypothetical protein [Hydrotalea sp.]
MRIVAIALCISPPPGTAFKQLTHSFLLHLKVKGTQEGIFPQNKFHRWYIAKHSSIYYDTI